MTLRSKFLTIFFRSSTSMPLFLLFFFFNDTATTEIYTLSLHDALPISSRIFRARRCGSAGSSAVATRAHGRPGRDRKSTRLNSSHVRISYAVFCLKKKKQQHYLLFLKSKISKKDN